MSNFDLAVVQIRLQLQLYFPTVLTTIVTDYLVPSVEQIEIEYQQRSKQLQQLPPVDAIWSINDPKVNFYRVDGSCIGSLLLPERGGGQIYRLVIAESKLYILRSTETIADGYYWEISTFETRENKVVLTSITNRWTSLYANFRSDNNQLAIVDCSRNYYYICRSSFDRQYISFGMEISDVARLNDHYFVLGAKDKKLIVAIYQCVDNGKPVFKSSFEPWTIYKPRYLTVTNDYIVLLTIGCSQSWIELYSHSGHFPTRTSGPVTWIFQEGLRTNGKQLIIDAGTGCSLFQYEWGT